MAIKGTIEQLKVQYRTWYESLKSAKCTLLDTEIVFNKHGFQHLFFKTNGKRRGDGDIRLRLGIVKHAPMIVRNARKMGDARICTDIKTGKDIAHYSLIHPVGKNKTFIEVVLRKVGTGQIHYYSVRYAR